MYPELFSIPIPGGYAALSYLAAVGALAMAVWFARLYRKQKLAGDLIFIIMLIIGSIGLFKDGSKRRAESRIRTGQWAAALDAVESQYQSASRQTSTDEYRALSAYLSGHGQIIRSDQRWFRSLTLARDAYYAAVGIELPNARPTSCGCGSGEFRHQHRPSVVRLHTVTEDEGLAALRAYRTAVQDRLPQQTQWLPAAIKFHGYSVMLMLAFLITTLLALYRAKRVGLKKNDIMDFAVVAVLCGVFGARAGAVFEQPDKFFYHEYHVERKEMRDEAVQRRRLLESVRQSVKLQPSELANQAHFRLTVELCDALLAADDIDVLLYNREQYEDIGIKTAVIGFADANGPRFKLLPVERLETELSKANAGHTADDGLWREYDVAALQQKRAALATARDRLLATLRGPDMPVPFGEMIERYADLMAAQRAENLNEHYEIGDLRAIESQLNQTDERLDRLRSRLRDASARNAIGPAAALTFYDGGSQGALERIGAFLWVQRSDETLPERKSDYLTWYAPFQVWAGGLTVLGGVILATIGLWFFCRRRGIPYLEFADFLGPLLIIGLGAGRVGCYVNGCCSGAIVTPDWYIETEGLGTSIYPHGSLPHSLYETTYNPADWISHCSDCDGDHSGGGRHTAAVAPDRPPQHPAPLYAVFAYWFLLAPFLEMTYVRRRFVGQTAGLTLML